MGRLMRGELERFEKEKVEDFKSGVETYLESAVEAQKEASRFCRSSLSLLLTFFHSLSRFGRLSLCNWTRRTTLLCHQLVWSPHLQQNSLHRFTTIPTRKTRRRRAQEQRWNPPTMKSNTQFHRNQYLSERTESTLTLACDIFTFDDGATFACKQVLSCLFNMDLFLCVRDLVASLNYKTTSGMPTIIKRCLNFYKFRDESLQCSHGR